jgi:omega-6 fatty acid desaturase (delta-12 desaturase)
VIGSQIKNKKSDLVLEHARPDDLRALTQVLMVLASLALVWCAAVASSDISLWLTCAAVLLISLFNIRAFALMHECGHGSLFRTQPLNRVFGFVLGVVCGMPQFVWSQHHSYHHATNGDWERYRGPYTTLSVNEYESMSHSQQRLYRGKCSIALAPFVGFIYLIFNPRFTWLKGSMELIGHMVAGKIARPHTSMRTIASGFETPCWQSRKQYWHMFWNNVALLSGWALMCWAIGPTWFFAIYVVALSLAGGAGILLFTVQHNFEHSYASDTRHWDHETGAIKGTSFLILPRWLNWFTANIGYHHIHHLSPRIPNYRLVACHDRYRDLFVGVARVKLSSVPRALKFILWDERTQRIISVAEYRGPVDQPV